MSHADKIEWLEKGNAEWREVALGNREIALAHERDLKVALATTRVAVAHLHAVLHKCRTAAEQQAADTAARDWLESIGSEST